MESVFYVQQNESLYRSGGVHGKGAVYVIVFTWLDVSVGLQEKKQPTRANSQGWLQYSCVLASLPVALSVYWIQYHSMGGILLWASLALDRFFFLALSPMGVGFWCGVFFMCLGATLVVVSNLLKKGAWNGFLLANVIKKYSAALEALSWLKQSHRTPNFVGIWNSLGFCLDFFFPPQYSVFNGKWRLNEMLGTQ